MSPEGSSGPVVDFGAHLHPKSVFPEEYRVFDEYIGEWHWNPEKLLELYGETDIDRAVLSQPYYMGIDDAGRARAANDALLEIVESFEQFYGLAAIPTGAGPEASVEEFERALDAGYHGGCLETRSSGIELTDPELDDVLSVAHRRDAPILVHPTLFGSLHPEVFDSHELNAIFGREMAVCESLCKCIHGGIYDRYPDLKLVFHHTAGNIAGMMGRVHLRLDGGRWPVGDDVVPFEAFERHLDNVYLDTCGYFGYRSPVVAALEEFNPSQILFGTDMPYEPRSPDELDTMVQTVRDASEEGAGGLLGQNALDILINV